MNFFVEISYIDLQISGSDEQVWGSSTFGYDPAEGYNISTRFNTVPEPFRVTGGSFDQGDRTFTFEDPDGRVVITFLNPDRFTSDTFAMVGAQEMQIESYTFTRN